MQPTSETLSHLTALFEPYTHDPATRALYLELRPLAPASTAGGSRQRGGRCWFPVTMIPQAAAHAERTAQRSDVYVRVLPGASSNSGRQEHLRAAWWIWADVDAGAGSINDVWDLITTAALPIPDLVVASGSGGLHCYWRLSSPVAIETAESRERLRQVLLRLCRAIGGSAPGPHADPGCAFPSSTLRVAGTLNHKHDPPRPVEIEVMIDNAGQTYDWWRANLPPLPSRTGPSPRREFSAERLRGRIADLIREPAPAGGGHARRIRIAAAAASLGLSEPDIEELLEQAEAGRGVRPDRIDIRAAARTAVRKFARPGGGAYAR